MKGMKRILLSTLLLGGCLNFVNAQNNVVKLHLESLAYGAANIGYERVLNEKLTLGVNVGLIIPRELPTRFYTEGIDSPDYVAVDNLKNKLSGTMIVPEFRFYPGSKGAPQGFYIGAYLKYNNYKLGMSETVTYDLSTQEYLDLDPTADYYPSVNHADRTIDVTTDMEFKLRQVGVGLQLGVQWIISDRVAIDWGFIGGGMNFYKATGELSVIDVPVDYSLYASEAAQQINEAIAEVPLLNATDAVVTDEGNSLKASIGFPMVGIRSFLSIGFKF